jgi:hypothetical protein
MGGPPDAALAKVGSIESRSGSAITIPEPRRNRRRESDLRAEMNGPTAGVRRDDRFIRLLPVRYLFRKRGL